MKFYISGLIINLMVVMCVEVNAQSFKEVSNDIGLDYNYPGIDIQEVGAGVVVFDFNNDGWSDIFQAGGIFQSKLWMNDQGRFVDVTNKFGLDSLKKLIIQGACAADFDNDGFEDLFLCNLGHSLSLGGDHKPPVLLRNINGKRFEPVFEETFSEIQNYPGCAWADINNDGFTDLYLLNYVTHMKVKLDTGNVIAGYSPTCNPNKFYLNQQGKGFKEISKSLEIDDDGCGLAVTFSDYDNDGDADLFLLNDFGTWNNKGNKLYKNEYPQLRFTDISDSSGFNEKMYGMGIGPGDYNNDGFMDYYLTNIGRNSLFQNKNGKLTEIAQYIAVDATYEKDLRLGTSWSGLFLDVENDGDLDLFVSKGYLESIEQVIIKDRNKLYQNQGDGSFLNISNNSGIDDSLANRGAALIDYDHDGDLDIVSGLIKFSRSEFAKLDQKIKLYQNITENENNWIGFKLVGSGNVNGSCIGCRVSFTNDQKIQLREVDGGSGHSSQSTKILYFGLGNNKYVSDIKIYWQGAPATSIDKLEAGKVYLVNQQGEIKTLY